MNEQNYKLSPSDILDIRKRLLRGEKQGDIAVYYNTADAVISSIKSGRSYNGIGMINGASYETKTHKISLSRSHEDMWVFTSKKTGKWFNINATEKQILIMIS